MDKNEIIGTLKKLVDDYPGDNIPYQILEDALRKTAGYQALPFTNDNPILKKFEETIARAKAVCSSQSS